MNLEFDFCVVVVSVLLDLVAVCADCFLCWNLRGPFVLLEYLSQSLFFSSELHFLHSLNL